MKTRQKLGVNAARLLHLHAFGDVSGHSEVWILVDSLRDEAEDFLVIAEDVGERVAEARDGRDGGEGASAAVVGRGEPEDAFA